MVKIKRIYKFSFCHTEDVTKVGWLMLFDVGVNETHQYTDGQNAVFECQKGR
jgi:hypothetical protein